MCIKAFLQAARPALVAMGFVNRAAAPTFALLFARVHTIPVDGALEEPTAAVTGIHAVVLARTTVTTNLAWDVQKTVP